MGGLLSSISCQERKGEGVVGLVFSVLDGGWMLSASTSSLFSGRLFEMRESVLGGELTAPKACRAGGTVVGVVGLFVGVETFVSWETGVASTAL